MESKDYKINKDIKKNAKRNSSSHDNKKDNKSKIIRIIKSLINQYFQTNKQIYREGAQILFSLSITLKKQTQSQIQQNQRFKLLKKFFLQKNKHKKTESKYENHKCYCRYEYRKKNQDFEDSRKRRRSSDSTDRKQKQKQNFQYHKSNYQIIKKSNHQSDKYQKSKEIRNRKISKSEKTQQKQNSDKKSQSLTNKDSTSSLNFIQSDSKDRSKDAGHYKYYIGEKFHENRYIVTKHLSDGTFGRVLEVKDTHNNNQLMALKIIRAVERYVESAETEAEIIFKLSNADKKNEYNFLKLDQVFSHKKNYCMVFEKLDFGGATFQHEHHSSTINTRQYRSPEVILQCCKWNESSDIWSIGCIIIELYSGKLYFSTHDNYEHIAMIEKVCGNIPQWMANDCKQEKLKDNFQISDTYFLAKRSFFDWPENATKENIESVQGLKHFNQIIKNEHHELIDLIQKCLQNDPNKRISCAEALNHEFFRKLY
ncbi:hypothetical protein IMG5_049940 [Ichthyophthirius multifiliis]|uniref:Protein kinase domain-containing protein n=1 Tax=Ichthyophthirius multifiliis TaxID=5932 RepID=G0QML5_ICHMU|nr:hypothetical protein IMG5_049940 [Ichthyophthirius multifiliis]EGR33534.1 hypothetical protein IMG5_049940 [Ichthyophthirius multifiliis]|eukprot:XP_004037520.1 hypothetical protein IMG5_049940 [Ichthyophthirius multifiliis]